MLLPLGIALAIQLHLSITAIETEHRKDPSTRTTTIVIDDNQIVVQKARSGRGATQPPPPVKRHLTDTEVAKVEAEIEASGLLDAADFDETPYAPGMDYSFAMDVEVAGKTKRLRLHGLVSIWTGDGKPPATTLAISSEYRAAVKLVEDLNGLANRE